MMLKNKTKIIFKIFLFIFLNILILGVNAYNVETPNLFIGDPNNLILTEEEIEILSSQKTYTEEDMQEIEIKWANYQQQLMQEFKSDLLYQKAQLEKVNFKLSSELQLFDEAERHIYDYNQQLQFLQDEMDSINHTLNFLQKHIELTKNRIENVETQIITKNREYKILNRDIHTIKKEINAQEKVLHQFARLIYTNEFLLLNKEDKKLSDIKLFLSAQDSIARTITENQYMIVVEKTGRLILVRLKESYMLLNDKMEELQIMQTNLAILNDYLQIEQNSLEQQKIYNQKLLADSQKNEKLYQSLIQEYQMQKEEVAFEIELTKTKQNEIDQALQSLQDSKNITLDDKTQAELDEQAKHIGKLLYESSLNRSDTGFIWPIIPLRGISAYFHDAGYVRLFGVDHYAIDIPAPQRTEIMAAKDGYVYRAKNNGYGYSYIILAHDEKVMTVYGHINEFKVKEGDVVSQGEIIALSGGAPGTLGAGFRTTGPHLHFELWIDGTRVDPLPFMPLEELPLDRVDLNKLPKDFVESIKSE